MEITQQQSIPPKQHKFMPKIVETIQIIQNNSLTQSHHKTQQIKGPFQKSQEHNIVKKNSKSHKKTNKKRTTSYSNQNRNVLPNSIHQILSYVQKSHKSGEYTKKVFEKICTNEEWTIKRYYTYQKLLKEKMNYYLKENSLLLLTKIHDPTSKIYSIQEQNFYMKVARILAKRYLESQAIPLFLNSKRMTNVKKIEHMKNRRQLINKIGNILRKQ